MSVAHYPSFVLVHIAWWDLETGTAGRLHSLIILRCWLVTLFCSGDKGHISAGKRENKDFTDMNWWALNHFDSALLRWLKRCWWTAWRSVNHALKVTTDGVMIGEESRSWTCLWTLEVSVSRPDIKQFSCDTFPRKTGVGLAWACVSFELAWDRKSKPKTWQGYTQWACYKMEMGRWKN